MPARSIVRRIGASLVLSLVLLAIGPAPAARPVHAAAGDLDRAFAGFGVGGALVTSQPTGWVVLSMALAPDGKVVAAGYTAHSILVMRYESNGLPDEAFGDAGTATFPGAGQDVSALGVAVQPDGRIVVAGWADTAPADFLVGRITVAGELDPSFGDGGFVTTDFDGDTDIANAVLIQPDGKIVAAGKAKIDGDNDFAVARYNPDGSLDTTFAGDGKGSAGFGGDDQAYAIALQPDGKLVLAGTKGALFDSGDFAVARFHGNGSPDAGFGTDGEVTTGFGGLLEIAHGVAIQADGRIIVAGDNYDDVKVARYLSDGRLDPTYDTDGKRSIGGLGGAINAIALQPDGKLVLLGYHIAPNVDFVDFRMAFFRLNPDSTEDASFGAGGRVVLDLIGGNAGEGVALQADGRIVGAGRDLEGIQSIVRLWPDGSIDAGGHQALGFDEPGFRPGSIESAGAMAMQTDGKLVVAGEVSNAERTESDAVLARFLPDGRPDASFGRYGRVSFGLGTFNGARALAVQPDGRIVAAGYFRTGRTVNFMVARFNANGTADSTFALLGQNVVDFMGGDDWGWALALAPDGKIVVAGEAFNGARTVFGVARFNDDGTPDLSFDVDGKQLIEFAAGPTHWATSVVVQPDGKIVLAGQVGSDFGLLRLSAAGGIDGAFGTGGWSIIDMGGSERISALVRLPGGGFVAGGTRTIGSDSDFALAQLTPNGQLTTCTGFPCSVWPTGKAFVSWGLSDNAHALALRGDGSLAVAGCAGDQFALAQLRMGGRGVTVQLQSTTDLVGSECAAGVAFTGRSAVVLAGHHAFEGDRNIALARFETTIDPAVDAPTATPPPTATEPPTATPTNTSTPAASLTPTPTATTSPTATSSQAPSPSATTTPSPTSEPSSTPSASTTPTKTSEPLASQSATQAPSSTPERTASASAPASPAPSGTATAMPTVQTAERALYLPWAGRD